MQIITNKGDFGHQMTKESYQLLYLMRIIKTQGDYKVEQFSVQEILWMSLH